MRMRMVFVWAVLMLAPAVSGCQDVLQPAELPRQFETPEYLGDTIGQQAFFTGADPILVQGVGLVNGLPGTGTRTMPPGLRSQMLKILAQHNVASPQQVLSDPNTAVVYISGYIPPGAQEGERFDLSVMAAPGTETTSLEGGTLLEADLSRIEPTRTGAARGTTLAIGQGEMFVSPFVASDRSVRESSPGVRPIGPGDASGEGAADEGSGVEAPPQEAVRTVDPRLAWVIGGGRVLRSRRFFLNLLEPSERLADQMVRHINTRFPNSAKGRVQPGIVDLMVPPRYAHDRRRFLDAIGAIYLVNSPQRREERMRELVGHLAAGPNRLPISAALESFGKACIPLVEPLLENADPAVRFHAADLLARLDQKNVIGVLQKFVADDDSPYQEAAVGSLGELPEGAGAGVIQSALDARSPTVRIAACMTLRRVAPRMLQAVFVPGRMELAEVRTRATPFVFVARSVEPRVVIFGDVRLKPPLMVSTSRLLASMQSGDKQVVLVNKRYGVANQLASGLSLAEVIRLLAAPPKVSQEHPKPQGLDLSYSDVVGFLEQARRQGSLEAQLVYEPIQIFIPDVTEEGQVEGTDIIIPER